MGGWGAKQNVSSTRFTQGCLYSSKVSLMFLKFIRQRKNYTRIKLLSSSNFVKDSQIKHPCYVLIWWSWLCFVPLLRSWASYQIRKIAGYACPGNAGNVFPPPTSKETAIKRSRHASRHVRYARAVMHVGLAIPRWRRKRSRHSRRMRNPQFYVSGKRPIMPSLFTKRSAVSHTQGIRLPVSGIQDYCDCNRMIPIAV